MDATEAIVKLYEQHNLSGIPMNARIISEDDISTFVEFEIESAENGIVTSTEELFLEKDGDWYLKS